MEKPNSFSLKVIISESLSLSAGQLLSVNVDVIVKIKLLEGWFWEISRKFAKISTGESCTPKGMVCLV